MVFDKNDQFAADLKRNVIVNAHVQNILMGIDDNRNIVVEGYPLQYADHKVGIRGFPLSYCEIQARPSDKNP